MIGSWDAFLSGFGIALSFIAAIGAQNAYVLKQGLKREHVLAICLTNGLSDTVLITIGVFGNRQFAELFPRLALGLQYLGAAFIIGYGLICLFHAFTKDYRVEDYFSRDDGSASPKQPASAKASFRSAMTAVLAALAFTWLNPHVYLDTLIIIGSLSQRFPDNLTSYIIGSAAASYVFFLTLGYGAGILTPWFKKPVSWKILDGGIGVLMLGLAVILLKNEF